MRVVREREVRGKKSQEIAYYISSLNYDNPKLLQAPRVHWGIENSLHWVLDVAYREDECRIREGYGAGNFSTLRRLTLNLLQYDKSKKVGIAAKRNIAGWDEKYREKLLKMI